MNALFSIEPMVTNLLYVCYLVQTWCMAKGIDFHDTGNGLKYIEHLRENDKYCANTLWCVQAMLGTWFKVVVFDACL